MNARTRDPAEASAQASVRKAPERDLELTDRDFARICELIYRRAGIVLANHKRDMVYSRLARRVRHYGLTRFGDYLARLERQPNAREWVAFTNALTTNLTAFFREAHHFPLLASHLSGRRGKIRIWCAAASTGEEAYSIAMQARESLGEKAHVEVLATDIDTDALARARHGIYSLNDVNKLDQARVKRFFLKGSGKRSGFARIRPDIAAMVEFRLLNLVSPDWSVDGPFDVIFCRNVMIYFDTETQRRIIDRFSRLLKNDGLLFAGHSENLSHLSDRFRLRGQTVYTLRQP